MAYHKFDCKDNANRAQNKMKSSFFFLEASYLRFSSCFILLSTRLFEFWLRRKYFRSGKKIKTLCFILLSTRLFEFWLRRKFFRSGKKIKTSLFILLSTRLFVLLQDDSVYQFGQTNTKAPTGDFGGNQ